jgi:SAM-dependent methyltransferase
MLASTRRLPLVTSITQTLSKADCAEFSMYAKLRSSGDHCRPDTEPVTLTTGRRFWSSRRITHRVERFPLFSLTYATCRERGAMATPPPGGSTMIAEMPAPQCVGVSSPFLPSIKYVRSKFTSQFHPSDVWHRVDTPVRFEQGDIMALDFPDNSFDRARAEQVLQHIPRPDTALAELTRVTRPGGLVAVMEPDWDTLVIDADNLGMSRAFTVYNSTVVVPRGHIGRQLPALFRDAGLVDVGCTATVLLPPYPALRERSERLERTHVG